MDYVYFFLFLFIYFFPELSVIGREIERPWSAKI